MLKQILIILLFFSLFGSTFKEDIKRMNQTSFNDTISQIDSLTTEINDTIPNKTLCIYTNSDGYPIKYSRDITTGVCIDGECRLVKINLFWNSTGRYLGFELPNGEFLSKTEHDPFKAQEYDRLQEILSENNSPLASYTIEELVPTKDTVDDGIDAISSATIAAVLDHIVEGAVYTTYTLWHIAYGPTKRAIEDFTSKKLDAKLSLLILNSNNIEDQVWLLNHISADMEILPELQSKLMELISGNDIYLAERSLNALKPTAITDEIQLNLATIFQSSGFLQKRLIIQKLKETPNIRPEVVQILSTELGNLNGTLVKNVLEMYTQHKVKDDYTVSEVVKLLKNDNRYISNQAFLYLDNNDNLDKKAIKALNKYKMSNS